MRNPNERSASVIDNMEETTTPSSTATMPSGTTSPVPTTTGSFKTVPKPFSIEAIISSDSRTNRNHVHPSNEEHANATAAVFFGSAAAAAAAAAAMHGLNLYHPWLADPLYQTPPGMSGYQTADAVISNRFSSGLYHHQQHHPRLQYPTAAESDSDVTSDVSMSPTTDGAQDLSTSAKINGGTFYHVLKSNIICM